MINYELCVFFVLLFLDFLVLGERLNLGLGVLKLLL